MTEQVWHHFLSGAGGGTKGKGTVWARFLLEWAQRGVGWPQLARAGSWTLGESPHPRLLACTSRRTANEDLTGNDITRLNGRRRGKKGMGWKKKQTFFSISSLYYFSFFFFFRHWSLVLLLHSLSLLWSFSRFKIWWKSAWSIKYILERTCNWCGWDLGLFR